MLTIGGVIAVSAGITAGLVMCMIIMHAIAREMAMMWKYPAYGISIFSLFCCVLLLVVGYKLPLGL